MKQKLCYTILSTIEKTWALALDGKCQPITDLGLVNAFDPEKTIILLHSRNNSQENTIIEELLHKRYFVIFFSDNPTTQEAINWFHKGIKGYLNSHASCERIKQALQTVMAGNIWLGQSVMQAIIASTYEPKIVNNSWNKLITEREKNTLDNLLTGKTNKEIANVMVISERTVKAHVSSLFKKFNVKDRLALVLYIKNLKK
jgi:DNA-binding NarL/FixJ family response regulator